jgi:3-dehydroquinate dehydratase/shikimate dehydrogenase
MCYLSLINFKVYDHLGVLKHFLSYMNDLSTLDLLSHTIGSVNCIIRRQNDGKLFGYNTDYVGAISAIEEGLRGI